MGDPSQVRVTGPLEPFAQGFIVVLGEAGYQPAAATNQVRLLAHLSRWLATEGLRPAEWLINKHTAAAAERCPSLREKKVTAHVLRHTTAMTLLQSEISTSVIALWLGHEQESTTRGYPHGDSQPATGSQAKRVERSSKAGRTWTLVASNTTGQHVRSDDIAFIGELPDAGSTGDLSVTSPSDAWLILTCNSVLFKTTDGGLTWTDAAPAKIDAQFPQEFSLTNTSMFVKSQNALWEHSTAGWKLVAGRECPMNCHTVKRTLSANAIVWGER